VNDNVVYFNILPGAHAGEHALVAASPFAGDYEIENRIMTVPARSGPHRIGIDRQMGSNRVQLWGTISADDTGTSEALAVEQPAQWCARLLAELLAKRGVVLRGHTRAHHLEMAELNTVPLKTNASVVLAAHDSLPLGMDIRVINKVSQNLHAEMLLRLLGHERGTSGSVGGGLEVLRGFLTQAGLLPEEYVFYDGSGLSRLNLVSPSATVKLLRYAARQPWGAEFIDSLPLAGVDGTLSGRFKNLPAGTVLRAKTGTLDHVNVLSGYLTTATGERLVFSILGNHHTMSGRQAGEVLDQIVFEAERTLN
jgi:D-alanyl-D-alanine carboxypeptidase/D-alanyl-D-alanine-endopeptidase (penicillin-binding protein 4)